MFVPLSSVELTNCGGTAAAAAAVVTRPPPGVNSVAFGLNLNCCADALDLTVAADEHDAIDVLLQ